MQLIYDYRAFNNFCVSLYFLLLGTWYYMNIMFVFYVYLYPLTFKKLTSLFLFLSLFFLDKFTIHSRLSSTVYRNGSLINIINIYHEISSILQSFNRKKPWVYNKKRCMCHFFHNDIKKYLFVYFLRYEWIIIKHFCHEMMYRCICFKYWSYGNE